MDRDPRVTRFIQGPWQDPVTHRAFVFERANATYPTGLGYWSVFNKYKNQTLLLGWVLLLPYHLYKDEVETGWRFKYKVWGRGYATEAASIVLSHAFNSVKLLKVVADINPLNVSSIAVAERLGMKYVEDRHINNEISTSYQIKHSNYLKRQ